jgi:glycosyltransferase involved in cell wall biosynthesis
MKIVQLITRLIVGGAQRIALETAAELRRRGVDAEIWCGLQAGPEGSLADEAAARGVPIVRVPPLVKEVSPARDLASLRWLERRLREDRPEVVHTHSSKAGIIGRRAAHVVGIPRVIHTIHGWGWSDRTLAPARAAFITAERAAAGWADRLIAVSDEVRREGLRRGIGKGDLYSIVRPGIDTAPYADLDSLRARGLELRDTLGIPKNAVVAGTVGRISPQKNPLAIVEAARAFPDLHWILVGDGPMRRAIEERSAALGIGDRVHLAGLRSDVPSCLGAMDLFVLTSRWEGLPLTILEARAAGLPVVAAEAGGTREAVPPSPAGRTFPPGDDDAFRAALAALLRELPTATARARRDRDLASLGLGRMLSEILDLYPPTR